jgi:ElaA protein
MKLLGAAAKGRSFAEDLPQPAHVGASTAATGCVMVAPMDPEVAPFPLEADATPSVPLRWQWARLEELASTELYAVIAARQQVFAVEQQCAFQDADGHDAFAWHLLGWSEAPEATLACYLRVLDPGRKFAEPSIGRVLTLHPYRGIGLGRPLMIEGLVRARAVWPGRSIRIAAQQRLEAFYASLAFRTVSPPYVEDGIPHIDMLCDAG